MPEGFDDFSLEPDFSLMILTLLNNKKILSNKSLETRSLRQISLLISLRSAEFCAEQTEFFFQQRLFIDRFFLFSLMSLR